MCSVSLGYTQSLWHFLPPPPITSGVGALEGGLGEAPDLHRGDVQYDGGEQHRGVE